MCGPQWMAWEEALLDGEGNQAAISL